MVRLNRLRGMLPGKRLVLGSEQRLLSWTGRFSHNGTYLLTLSDAAAAIEEWVVSNAKRAIPESVKHQFNEWRAAWHATYKGLEKEEVGDNHISEEIEKVGWGVEEAQQAHKADASKFTP